MFYKYSYRYFAPLAIATLLEVITSSIFLADTRAQTFEPPTSNPAPTTTIGGGRRGSDGQCLKDRDLQPRNIKIKQALGQQLIPLLPPNKFGLTISANPTFFAYIPKTSAIAVEFTLENQQGKGITRKRVQLTNTPSIVNIQFDTEPLEVGKDYKWLISVICETGDPEDAFSEGIIRRIKPEPNLLKKLEKASEIEKVFIYAKFGIWHEAISKLANLRLSQPDSSDLKISWLTLLKSSSLETLANTPLKN
ncbi:MAG: hypothetical protein DCF19_11950 [Pseudanabaena frigida]|uniref:DUF928 domain-containing protein n=1 Tax=Pseudanabaena frigida TaxID=945775 RepID=A0A2W4W769_9CYAN|nr:MAG: hypothetical protein DCF19_11950 [Pseudanabaena frigida]